MKYEINLNLFVKQLDGSDSNINLGLVIGEAISRCGADQAKGQILKYIGWARDLATNKVLSLDESDYQLFKDLISTLNGLNINVLGQALEACIKAKG